MDHREEGQDQPGCHTVCKSVPDFLYHIPICIYKSDLLQRQFIFLVHEQIYQLCGFPWADIT